MDLKERDGFISRHPWELSRLKALERIFLRSVPRDQPLRVLDIGCGDGFIVRAFADMPWVVEAHGLDVHLAGDEISSMSDGKTKFFNAPDRLSGRYDVIFLCDVLEHVPDDRAFLHQITIDHAAPGALFIITVPAWPFLFSSHDIFLQHHRRYSPKKLGLVIRDAGLKISDSGSLFFSLLAARCLQWVIEKICGPGKDIHGVGQWKGGRAVTRIVTAILDLDNQILRGLSRAGLRVAGLSLWVSARAGK